MPTPKVKFIKMRSAKSKLEFNLYARLSSGLEGDDTFGAPDMDAIYNRASVDVEELTSRGEYKYHNRISVVREYNPNTISIYVTTATEGNKQMICGFIENNAAIPDTSNNNSNQPKITMMTELKNIPLTSITMMENYRDVEPPTEKDPEIIDLSVSIKAHGVMQAIMVRPSKKKKDHYELIFGHRRFMASKVAGMETIPAAIKEVADADILEYQVTENLQRKDVHPMDEAKAFQAYMALKKCDVKELAAKFAKSEKYIAHRLGMNNLNPDIQKDFLKGLMSVGQAEVFAKLNATQQKDLRSQAYSSYDKRYRLSPDEMKNHIERNFLLKLDAAPWKRDDAKLVPSAGSCNDCQKRTACHSLLFADLTKDDRCMDSVCYKTKKEAWFKMEVEKVATTKPEISFIRVGEEMSKDIAKIAKDYNISVLNYYDSSVHSGPGKGYTSVKCFIVAGSDKGQYKTYYLEQRKAAKAGVAAGAKPSAAAVTEEIKAINQRLDRATELDYEKVMATIRKQLEEKYEDDKPIPQKSNARMEGIAWFILYDLVSYHADDVMVELLINEDSHEEWDKKPGTMIEAMMNLSTNQKANIIYHAFKHKYGIGITARAGKEAFMLRELATMLDIDISAIEADQNAIATKRKSNAAKKIEGLRNSVPVKAVKPAVKKKAKK